MRDEEQRPPELPFPETKRAAYGRSFILASNSAVFGRGKLLIPPPSSLSPQPSALRDAARPAVQVDFRLSANTLPSLPLATSNETFWPSLRAPRPERSTAEICTNTSFEPSSGWMNPKPLVGLNHFTVPIVTASLLWMPGSG